MSEFKQSIAELVETRRDETAEKLRKFHQEALDEVLCWVTKNKPNILNTIKMDYRYLFNQPEDSEDYKGKAINENTDGQFVHREKFSLKLPSVNKGNFLTTLFGTVKECKGEVSVYFIPKNQLLRVQFDFAWVQSFTGYECFGAPIPNPIDNRCTKYFDLITHDPDIKLTSMTSKAESFAVYLELS